jgi:hypothetical protein
MVNEARPAEMKRCERQTFAAQAVGSPPFENRKGWGSQGLLLRKQRMGQPAHHNGEDSDVKIRLEGGPCGSKSFYRTPDPPLSDSPCSVRLCDSVARWALLDSEDCLAHRGMRLALFGWIGTFSYAIPALNDFHNALAPLSQTIVVNLILWGICIGAWVIVVRCLWFALRKDASSQPS